MYSFKPVMMVLQKSITLWKETMDSSKGSVWSTWPPLLIPAVPETTGWQMNKANEHPNLDKLFQRFWSVLFTFSNPFLVCWTLSLWKVNSVGTLTRVPHRDTCMRVPIKHVSLLEGDFPSEMGGHRRPGMAKKHAAQVRLMFATYPKWQLGIFKNTAHFIHKNHSDFLMNFHRWAAWKKSGLKKKKWNFQEFVKAGGSYILIWTNMSVPFLQLVCLPFALFDILPNGTKDNRNRVTHKNIHNGTSILDDSE